MTFIGGILTYEVQAKPPTTWCETQKTQRRLQLFGKKTTMSVSGECPTNRGWKKTSQKTLLAWKIWVVDMLPSVFCSIRTTANALKHMLTWGFRWGWILHLSFHLRFGIPMWSEFPSSDWKAMGLVHQTGVIKLPILETMKQCKCMVILKDFPIK